MSQSHEPLDRVVERLLDGDHHSRREFVRRLGAMGAVTSAGAFLAACGGVSGTENKQDKAAAAQPANHPKTAIGTLVVSNWPLYIDKATPKGWQKAENAQAQLHRGHQRERRVLRQGPPAARGRAGHRPRPRRAHRLDGGALGRRGLHGEDRQAQRPQREEPAPRAAAPGLRPQPRLHAALAVGHHGHRLQPEEDGRQAHEHQRPVRPEVQGPRVVHLGAAHDSASLVLLGMGTKPARRPRTSSWRRSRSSTRPTRRGRSAGSPATTTPTTSPRGTSGPARPTPATSSSCSPTTRTLEFLVPEEGGVLCRTT